MEVWLEIFGITFQKNVVRQLIVALTKGATVFWPRWFENLSSLNESFI